MEEKKLYRKVALDRLSSPEQLDRLMTITRPTGWLALLGIAVVVISALIWGIWGSIPTKIYGEGILIRGGGIHHIVPLHSGHLTDIRIEEGDTIKKGQVVARISQSELESEMVQLNREIEKLKSENIDDPQIISKVKRLEEIREDFLARTRIVSSDEGRVLEVMKKQGNFISHDEPLLSFEAYRGGTRELETFLFAPAAQGQMIEPGMDVQVDPFMFKREEYGFINGKVMSVSEYPVSHQWMMNLLENEELVRAFSQGGAPVVVRVELIPESGNMSGYQWSAGPGPQSRIESGSLISGAVIIKEEPPLNKIFPLF